MGTQLLHPFFTAPTNHSPFLHRVSTCRSRNQHLPRPDPQPRREGNNLPKISLSGMSPLPAVILSSLCVCVSCALMHGYLVFKSCMLQNAMFADPGSLGRDRDAAHCQSSSSAPYPTLHSGNNVRGCVAGTEAYHRQSYGVRRRRIGGIGGGWRN